MQTPNDGGPFCSLAVASFHYGTGGIFIADHNFQLGSLLSNQEYYVPHYFHDGYTRMDFLLLPILVFEWHVAYTAKQLTTLKRRVSKVEDKVGSSQGWADPSELSSELNRCSSSLLILDRRWHFERTVAQHLLTYCETFALQHVHPVGKRGAYYVPSSQQRVKFHLEMSKTLEYDIGVLPRRIKLQQTAVSPAQNSGSPPADGERPGPQFGRCRNRKQYSPDRNGESSGCLCHENHRHPDARVLTRNLRCSMYPPCLFRWPRTRAPRRRFANPPSRPSSVCPCSTGKPATESRYIQVIFGSTF